MRAVFLFLLVLVAPIVVMAQSNTTGIMHRASGTPGPTPTPTLPPQGVYNGCEIDTNLSNCETEDAAIASDGFKWEINYQGLWAHKTGAGSLASWFAYDASIGLSQVLPVENAAYDATSALTGTSLVTYASTLASDCGATTNQQLIQCIVSVAATVPGFNYEWYIYDEPGCPNQSIGNCGNGNLSGHYNNVNTLAAYIASIDSTHAIRGIQSGGGCNNGDCSGEVNSVQNLYSCNGQPPCAGSFPWITDSTTPNTGFDYYPLGPNGSFNGNEISDIGTIATDISAVLAANYASETMAFTGQAFSWLQEGDSACGGSITTCAYPTTQQMQYMRDEALFYANKAGYPISRVFWYSWSDITCASSYTGCSATANRTALKTAAFASFPTVTPTAVP